jgi:hypothetical protein
LAYEPDSNGPSVANFTDATGVPAPVRIHPVDWLTAKADEIPAERAKGIEEDHSLQGRKSCKKRLPDRPIPMG